MHYISSTQFTTEWMDVLFTKAKELEEHKQEDALKNKILINWFLEPSTRTRVSFEVAMLRLGGKVINISENSSLKKGESEEDTIRVLSDYGDVVVLRHPEALRVKNIAASSRIPVINAGDGDNEHPTQALLDFYTIKQYKDLNKQVTILFTGDMAHSRTINSLLPMFNGYNFHILFENSVPTNTPKTLNCSIIPTDDIPKYLPHIDILYMTRIQKERSSGDRAVKFRMYPEIAKNLRLDTIIMHPLPHLEELSGMDDDVRSVYFKQSKNGIYIRMALLLDLFNVENR